MVRRLAARLAEMIRIEAAWLAAAPMDMRAGTDTVLAGWSPFSAPPTPPRPPIRQQASQPSEDLVHDGICIWQCAGQLHQGRFAWASPGGPHQLTITRAQLDALVLGFP